MARAGPMSPRAHATADRPTPHRLPKGSPVMTVEPIVAPAQTEAQVIETTDHAAVKEHPTEQQQQVSDGVFSRQQQEAVAALLAMQVAGGLLHNCALEASRP